MQPKVSTFFTNAVVVAVPDLFICWFFSNTTQSGLSGFGLAFAGLQAIYLLFWIKTAAWSWLVFWLGSKRRMADELEEFFKRANFPPPGKHIDDIEDYLNAITHNDGLAANTRRQAAFELGTFSGLKMARRHSTVRQLSSAARVALRRHAQSAPTKTAPESMSVQMLREDFEKITWLADYGFRVWINPADDPMRPGKQLSYPHAFEFAVLLSKFERSIFGESQKGELSVRENSRLRAMQACYQLPAS